MPRSGARSKQLTSEHRHRRNEIREGQQRAQSRTYYYVDYRQAIDAIKWKNHTMIKDAQGLTVVPTEKKEYRCPRCKAQWTSLEVLDSVGPNGFECHNCGGLLIHDLKLEETGHEETKRLNQQLKFISDKLQEIDEVPIPDNTFDVAYSHRREVVRDATNPAAASVAVDTATSRPTAVHGLQNTGPKTMAVNISSSDGPTEAEVAAEAARKRKIAEQNAKPEWITVSTVTGESFVGKGAEAAAAKQEQKDTNVQVHAQEHHAEVEDFFARLKAQQAVEQANKREDDESDEEDEDDVDFEDVVAGSNAAAPTTPAAASASATLPLTADKPDVVEGQDDGGSMEPLAKRIKAEEPSNGANNDGGESEDDIEFEDV